MRSQRGSGPTRLAAGLALAALVGVGCNGGPGPTGADPTTPYGKTAPTGEKVPVNDVGGGPATGIAPNAGARTADTSQP